MTITRKQIGFVLLVTFSGGAIAQTTSAPNAPATGKTVGVISAGVGGVIGGIIGGAPYSIPGHPYSAEQISEHVQTLADGTHITQITQKNMLYRDSEGRTRSERYFTPPGTAPKSEPNIIEIMDPVAGYRYTLNPHTHTAQRMGFGHPIPVPTGTTTSNGAFNRGVISQVPPPPPPPHLATDTTQTASARPHPTTQRESLGTQTMEGVIAEGIRTTTTYPEGFLGNDRPITAVSEMWNSPDLQMTILSTNSDPRFGDTTTKLINVSLSEPDPSLFQVPADYTVTENQPAGVARPQ